MRPAQWISAHLFYHDNLEIVIHGWVRPLVADLAAQEAIRRWFFIRYWQGGPHIRLRLLPVAADAEPLVRTQLEQRAAAFLAARPSTAQLPVEEYQRFTASLSQFEYGQDCRVQIYPNNSLHYIAYEPEYARYGGPLALEAVEEHFGESSAIAGELLARAGGHAAVRAALAMQLLAMGLCMGDISRLGLVFERRYHVWMRSFGPNQAAVAQEIAAQYSRQRTQLQQLVGTLLRYLRRPEGTRLDPLSERWRQSVVALHGRLRDLEQRRELVARPAGAGTLLDQPAAIVLDGLHMHNNRLGISLTEEAYQSFVLARTLSESAVPLAEPAPSLIEGA
ncbi:MAG: thiopeptide-type bacteriocin biosynthesis protein [Roseiflexaceae bacterium]